MIGAISLRLYLIKIGIGNNDPWSYRFFPLELALFLAGAISHQFLRPVYQWLFADNVSRYSLISSVFVLVLCAVYSLIPLSENIKTLALIGCVFFFLPMLFLFQNSFAFDKFIGDFSYPIYIIHMLVVSIIAKYRGLLGDTSQLFFSLTCLVFTLLLAWLSIVSVITPFEGLRQRYKR
jgi:peptidoglycan/LPS O-acetylase OafA/YrhL